MLDCNDEAPSHAEASEASMASDENDPAAKVSALRELIEDIRAKLDAASKLIEIEARTGYPSHVPLDHWLERLERARAIVNGSDTSTKIIDAIMLHVVANANVLADGLKRGWQVDAENLWLESLRDVMQSEPRAALAIEQSGASSCFVEAILAHPAVKKIRRARGGSTVPMWAERAFQGFVTAKLYEGSSDARGFYKSWSERTSRRVDLVR